MYVLMLLVVLPLVLILGQQAVGYEGVVGYSIYKIAFIVPPLIYCRVRGIGLFRDILRFERWRHGLAPSIVLGLVAVGLFWLLYWLLANRLVDEDAIVEGMKAQFSVTAKTVLLIAPFTIVVNSLLEEFFYRGFSFGLLVKKNTIIGYLLPAAVYTVQHVLFFREWLDPIPFIIATGGLFVFALILAKVYSATKTIVAPWIIHIFGDIAMMGIAVMLLL